MKSIKALLVAHDDETRLAVDDILSTLGHRYDTAHSLAEAKDLLAADGYAYVLTDFEIPARPGGKPRMQNTEHLLAQAGKVKRHMPPVVVIADRLPHVDDEDKFRWAADMRTRGATTFICRPFRTGGRTLDRVIQKLMARHADGVRLESIPLMSRKEPPIPPGTTNAIPLGPLPPSRKAPVKLSRESAQGGEAAPVPSSGEGRWASVPNEPIDLDSFMARFCEPRGKENRICRKRALLAAARHKAVTLPPLAGARKHGQANKYFTHDLLAAWQGFRDEGVELPPALPEYKGGTDG